MGRKAGRETPIGGIKDIDKLDIHALKQKGRRPNDRMMRSGEAKDAMVARRVVWGAGRQVRSALGIMETEFKSRRVIACLRGKRKSAEYDQQALRGNGIGDEDAGQRPP